MFYTRCVALLPLTVLIGAVHAADAPPATEQKEAVVVQLNSEEPLEQDKGARGSLFSRELFREALLISARDHFGALTRDQTLREPFLERTDHVITLDLHERVKPYAPTHVEVSRAGHGGLETLLTLDLGANTTRNGAVDLPAQITDAAKFIDSADGMLSKAGLQRIVFPARAVQALPAEVERELNQLNVFASFSAARRLHEMIRQGGPTPVLEAGLARAYANLGEETRFLWNASYEAFNARAALYAEALVRQSPQSAFALWQRAYVRALVSLHKDALADLDAAEKLQQSGQDETSGAPPVWVETLRNYCQFHVKLLLGEGAEHGRPDAALANQLAFLITQYSGCQAWEMDTATAALKHPCDRLRILDAMCTQTGPGMLNEITETAPQFFAGETPGWLNAIPEMPRRVIREIASQGDAASPEARAKLATLVLKSGTIDTQEPSLGILGSIMREINFVQVWRRTDLIAWQWGQDASDYLNETAPLYVDHPYKAWLLNHKPEYRDDQRRHELFADTVVTDAVHAMRPFVETYFWASDAGKAEFGREWRHQDDFPEDLERMGQGYLAQYFTGKPPDEITRTGVESVIDFLKDISPNDPMRYALMIASDAPDLKSRQGEWEGLLNISPPVCKAFAQRAIEQHHPDDALQPLRTYIALSPDKWGYETLAQVYKDKKDIPHWKTTLDEFLTHEDYGLQHAQVQCEIADYYLEQRKYQDAEPYALAAANTYAAWAMSTAASVEQGLQKWEKAEYWVAADAGQYTSDSGNYYFWCRYTGHGNLVAARKVLEQGLDASDAQMAQLAFGQIGMEVGEGNFSEAAKVAQQQFLTDNDPWTELHAALAYDALKDTARRDGALRKSAVAKLADLDHPARTQMKELAQAFITQLAAGKADQPALEKIIAEAPDEAASLGYFAGKFLLLHGGTKEGATHFFELSIKSTNRRTINMSLSAMELRKLGGDPLKLEPVFIP